MSIDKDFGQNVCSISVYRPPKKIYRNNWNKDVSSIQQNSYTTLGSRLKYTLQSHTKFQGMGNQSNKKTQANGSQSNQKTHDMVFIATSKLMQRNNEIHAPVSATNVLKAFDFCRISRPNRKKIYLNNRIDSIFWNKNILCHDTFKEQTLTSVPQLKE